METQHAVRAVVCLAAGAAFLAVFAGGFPLSAEEEEKGAPSREALAGYIRELGSEELAMREAAKRKLIEAGEAALPVLRKAASDPDPEVAARSREALAQVERNVAKRLAARAFEGIKMDLLLPESPVSLPVANSNAFRFRVRVTNDNRFEVHLLKSWAIEVIGPDKRPLKTSRFMRAGVMDLGVWRRAVLRIPPGKTAEVDFSLSSYEGQFLTFAGYDLPAPGIYRIRLQYAGPETWKGRRDAIPGLESLLDPVATGERSIEGDLEARAPSEAESRERQARVESLVKRMRSGKLYRNEAGIKEYEDASGWMTSEELARLNEAAQERSGIR